MPSSFVNTRSETTTTTTTTTNKNNKEGSSRMSSRKTPSQSTSPSNAARSPRRRLGRSSSLLPTMKMKISRLRRVITVFTGMVFLGFVWNVYQFGGYNNYSEGSSVQTRQQKQSSERTSWNELRRKKLDHSPVELKSKQKSKCKGFDYSIRRPKHGCQVNEDTRMVFCNFDHLRIDVSKINMVAHGGEDLDTVMGRNEDDEFPTYQKAAFSTRTKPHFEVPTEFRSHKTLHYLDDVLNALRYPTKKNKGKLDMTCHHTYQGTTLFITRYEYANLFHTLTDWWNAFFVLPRRSKNSNSIEDIVKADRVVFLDGHAKGLLDPVWGKLFGEYHYIKQMGSGGNGGGICFEKAIFLPPGYKSHLYNDFRDGKRCPHTGMTKAFSDYVLHCYDLLSSGSSSSVIQGNVVIIDRQPFVAHPRSHPTNLSRRFVASELQTLQKRLRDDIPGVHSVNLVRFETLSFGEQLKLLRTTQFLIGIHGAALSHLVFMDEAQSHAIEFQPATQLDFFEYLSQWKGIDFKVVPLQYGSNSLADTKIDEVVQIVKQYVH